MEEQRESKKEIKELRLKREKRRERKKGQGKEEKEKMERKKGKLRREGRQGKKSTAYTWLDCCCFNAAQIVLTSPAPRNGGPFLPFFGQAGQVDPLVGWRSCY